jgi:hypothetical protein
MSVLRNLESKLAGLVEGTFSRAFKSEVRPVEIARKLAKEMEEHKVQSLSRVYAPNEYAVWLSKEDRKQFEGYEDALVAELQEYLAEHARREKYALLDTPTVLVTVDDDLAVGEFGIATRLVAAEASPSSDPAPPLALPVDQPAQTMVYKAPPPVVPEAPPPEPEREMITLTVAGRKHEITSRSVVLGRSREADVRVADVNVSRRHAELRQEGATYWIVDLGSTNGLEVNGTRVDRARLRDGDRITVGATEVVFGRSLPS